MAGPVLQVGATVDIAAFKAGMEQAKSETKTAATAMEQSYKELAAEAAASGTQIKAAWLDVAVATAAATKAKDQLRAAGKAVKQQTGDETLALIEHARALLAAEVAARALAIAQEQIATAAEHIPPAMAAVSTGIRVGLGEQSIRGVERLLVTTLQLGPVFQKLFPYLGVLALGEMLVHVGKKVVELYDNFVNLKQVIEAVTESGKKMGEATTASFERTKEMQIGMLNQLGKFVEGAKMARELAVGRPIKLETEMPDKKKMEAMPKEIAEGIEKVFANIVPSQLAGRIRHVKSQLAEVTAEAERLSKEAIGPPPTFNPSQGSGASQGMVNERTRLANLEAAKVYKTFLVELQALQKEHVVIAEKGAGDIVEAGKKEEKKREEATHKALAAAKARAAAIKEADEEEFHDIQDHHLVDTQEAIAFWSKKLQMEKDNAIRVIDLKRTLGGLKQQADREEVEAGKKSITQGAAEALAAGGKIGELAYLQAQQDGLKALVSTSKVAAAEYEEVIKRIPAVSTAAMKETQEIVKKSLNEQYEEWLAGGKRTLESQIAWWQQVKSSYASLPPVVEDATAHIVKEQQKLIEQTLRLQKVQREQADEAVDAAHRQRDAYIQASSETGLNLGAVKPSRSSKTDNLKTLGSASSDNVTQDQQMLAEDQDYYAKKLALAETSAAQIKATYREESPEYATAQKKIQTIQEQSSAKLFADHVKLIKDLQTHWKEFFNAFNQGFISAMNSVLQGQKSFGAAMKEMLGQLVLQMIDAAAMELLVDAEKWAMKRLFAAKGEAAMTAEQTKHVTENAAANVAMATSDAALASAGAFAFFALTDPLIAPEMAAAYYSAGLAIASLAAFEQGGIVPNTGIALVHKGEGIMSQPLTREMLTGAGQQSGDVHNYGGFNYHAAAGQQDSRSAANDMHRQFTQLLRRKNMVPKARFA